MANFEIECEVSLGLSHYGEVTENGKGSVELTDEETEVLINLIREKKTTDVNVMGLKESHPAIYEKLDKAYHKLAYKTEELHWLINGFENGYFEYDLDEVMKYCEEHCGYEFVLKKDILPDNVSPEFIATFLEVFKDNADFKRQDFCKWLPDYLSGINIEEACDFMYSHLNAEVDMDDDVNYVVGIPPAIIDMSNGRGE